MIRCPDHIASSASTLSALVDIMTVIIIVQAAGQTASILLYVASPGFIQVLTELSEDNSLIIRYITAAVNPSNPKFAYQLLPTVNDGSQAQGFKSTTSIQQQLKVPQSAEMIRNIMRGELEFFVSVILG